MYNHLIEYRPFFELISMCRGSAISLKELSSAIFPDEPDEEALQAVSILLAIAPLAKSERGAVLFPARMHMLFKGIKGVYACTNPDCKHSHTEGGLTLGEIYLSDFQHVHIVGINYHQLNYRRSARVEISHSLILLNRNFRFNPLFRGKIMILIDCQTRDARCYSFQIVVKELQNWQETCRILRTSWQQDSCLFWQST